MKQFLVLHHTVGPDPGDARYHGVIDRDGFFHFRLNPDLPAAATFRSNSRTVNLAVVGNYEILLPTERQIFVITQVFAAWARRFSLSADSIVSHGWIGQNCPGAPRYSTACCGKNLIARLPEIRLAVSRYLL